MWEPSSLHRLQVNVSSLADQSSTLHNLSGRLHLRPVLRDFLSQISTPPNNRAPKVIHARTTSQAPASFLSAQLAINKNATQSARSGIFPVNNSTLRMAGRMRLTTVSLTLWLVLLPCLRCDFVILIHLSSRLPPPVIQPGQDASSKQNVIRRQRWWGHLATPL